MQQKPSIFSGTSVFLMNLQSMFSKFEEVTDITQINMFIEIILETGLFRRKIVREELLRKISPNF